MLRAAVQNDHTSVAALLRSGAAMTEQGAVAAAMAAAAARGHLAVVAAVLQHRPAMVDERREGRTMAMLAAHEGHIELLDYLLQVHHPKHKRTLQMKVATWHLPPQAGASPSLADAEGDLAIHYSVLGDHPAAVLTLVNRCPAPASWHLSPDKSALVTRSPGALH